MIFESKSYGNKNYIEYKDEESELVFNNASYFMFDVTSKTFHDIMSSTGGFVANVTTRYMKEHNIDAAYIMLCTVPQEYNDYLFKFVYLDKNMNILKLDPQWDNNYFDYAYFRKKFSDCIVKEGLIFELEQIDSLQELTNLFYPNPSTDFNFQIDGRNVSFNDIFVYNGIGVFKDSIQEELKQLDAETLLFQFDFDTLNGIDAKGMIITADGNPLLNYQFYSGILDKDEYLKEACSTRPGFTEENVDCDIYEFILSLEQIKAIANELHFAGDMEQVLCGPDITDDTDDIEP